MAHGRPDARSAIVYFHGIESHAGWFARSASLLAGHDHAVYCLDRRGSGINREARGFPSGYTPSWRRLVDDARAFIAPLRERTDRLVLAGLSWGGKLAVAYALSHPDDCDGLVLVTPGLRAKVDVSLPTKLKVFAGALLAPRTAVAIPIEPEMFTTTPEHLDFIRKDPLRLHRATARFLFESKRLDGWIDANIDALTRPLLLFLAGGDRIIDNEGVRALLARAGVEVAVRDYDDQTHSIQFDAPERMVTDIQGWIDERVPLAAAEGTR